MRSIQVFPVFHGFFDGRGRRVPVVFERNAEVGEELVKFGVAVHEVRSDE
jgi:endonuclease YncB( thermonuclease family)